MSTDLFDGYRLASHLVQASYLGVKLNEDTLFEFRDSGGFCILCETNSLTRHFRIHTKPPIEWIVRTEHVDISHPPLFDDGNHFSRFSVPAHPPFGMVKPCFTS